MSSVLPTIDAVAGNSKSQTEALQAEQHSTQYVDYSYANRPKEVLKVVVVASLFCFVAPQQLKLANW